ncbi:serine/threonine-protein kinase [Actinophytocola sp. NPDC049390]|uniref:serine/threonine-protein kinase n=1 Tax=Actinophytocola sp. NPDC049390 TaxID=3363894 RepID=UPI00378FD5C2
MTGEGHLLAGRYRLVRPIGTGAMGVVWQGHDELLARPVAIKKLLATDPQTPEKVARCLREGRIAARLQHPNAITVFDVVDEDGVPNLVMEYLPARSLATTVAEDGPLTPEAAAAVGAQVAAALAAAHAAGIVHRDITPANILLGEDGTAKLTDFGISRIADDAATTRTGLVAGTPAYLAPEVALGGEPTPASDVFSLGSTLYAAVEGEPPFGLGPNVLGLLHAVASGEITPPTRSGPLTDALLALLTTDPDTRPTADRAHDLLTAVDTAPAPAGTATPADGPDTALMDPPTELVAPVPAASSRPRGPLAVTGVFVVALVVVGLWLLGGQASMRQTPDRAPAEHGEKTQTPGTSVPVPVAPAVGKPVEVDDEPATRTTTTPPAPTTSTGRADPTTTTTTTPPAPTTTDEGPEQTTDVTTTTPPPTSEETTTPPDGETDER